MTDSKSAYELLKTIYNPYTIDLLNVIKSYDGLTKYGINLKVPEYKNVYLNNALLKFEKIGVIYSRGGGRKKQYFYNSIIEDVICDMNKLAVNVFQNESK